MLPYSPNTLLLTRTSIKTLLDLQPFFNTLVSPALTHVPSASTSPAQSPLHLPTPGPAQDHQACLQHIEAVLERDFLEPLPG